MKQFRMLGRSVRDAFKSVFRNFSLSIASISCITITLLIVSISMILSYNAENISTLIKKDFSIVVFVQNDATKEDVGIEVKTQLLGAIIPESTIYLKSRYYNGFYKVIKVTHSGSYEGGEWMSTLQLVETTGTLVQ